MLNEILNSKPDSTSGFNPNQVLPLPLASDQSYHQADSHQALRSDEAIISSHKMSDLKFDLYYEQVRTSSKQATFLDGDGAQQLSQEMFHSVKARLKLDFSFLTRIADQSGKAAGIDEETYSNFVKAAKNLSSMDQESLDAFMDAVDDVFKAVETANGLPETSMDQLAAFTKSAVHGFFEKVDTALQEIDQSSAHAGQQFRESLAEIVARKASTKDLLADFKEKLVFAGLPEGRREAFLRLAELVSKLAEHEKSPPIFNLNEFTERLLRRANESDAGSVDEMQAAQAQKVRFYSYSESAERVNINLEHSEVDVVSA